MKALLPLVPVLLALAGCAAEPLPIIGPASSRHSPANPSAPAARTSYLSVTSGYRHYTPVAAGDWRQLNRRVAPPQQPSQGGHGHAH
jgi:hypothetical protein